MNWVHMEIFVSWNLWEKQFPVSFREITLLVILNILSKKSWWQLRPKPKSSVNNEKNDRSSVNTCRMFENLYMYVKIKNLLRSEMIVAVFKESIVYFSIKMKLNMLRTAIIL